MCPSLDCTKRNNRLMLLRLILTLTIFLPTLAVYAHELSHHQHQDCENTVVHLHEYENDCYLDDFISNKIYTYSTNILSLIHI